jgi:hypothetical protein
VLDGSESSITVTAHDTARNIIEGSFEVTFVHRSGRRWSDPLRSFADTLRFANGRFRAGPCR